MVEFNNPVMIGETTLPAGKYQIRQLATANNPRIFEFVSEDENRTAATASASPVVDNLARHPTSVVLTQRGSNYHVSQMWIAGETYGYEFSRPEGREVELAAQTRQSGDLRMTGTYTQQTTQTQTTDTTAQQAEQDRLRREAEARKAEEERAAAQRAEQDRLRQEQERAAAAKAEQDRLRQEQERAAAQRAEEDRARQEAERAAAQRAEEERLRRERERTEIAQARPPAQPPAETNAGGAAQMPDTAAGWPAMTLGGLLLMGMGALARRFGR
jgi:hypothetical protein